MSRPGSRVVYLHIGAPKTGTTYVQDRLTRNRALLAQHDVHLPAPRTVHPPTLYHFRAALDLIEKDWGGRPGHAEGAWEGLVRRIRRGSGRLVVSHEIFAPARPERIERLARDLRGEEVHLVYSARDLGRQLPAAWQEAIKQGQRWSFGRFLDRAERGRTWFFHAFDLPNVLDKWSVAVPPERMHVVTVPSRTAQADHPDLLWLRMCQAFGIDPVWAPKDSARANRSLGVAETQVLRRLNRRMDPEARRQPAFDDLVRKLLAEQNLVHRSSAPVRLPPDRFDWAEAQAERWVEWLTASGVQVVGELSDLRPGRPDPEEPWVDPDRVRPKESLAAAIDALTAMTQEAARRTDPDRSATARARKLASRVSGR